MENMETKVPTERGQILDPTAVAACTVMMVLIWMATFKIQVILGRAPNMEDLSYLELAMEILITWMMQTGEKDLVLMMVPTMEGNMVSMVPKEIEEALSHLALEEELPTIMTSPVPVKDLVICLVMVLEKDVVICLEMVLEKDLE
jgi:hypothetical protein